MRMGARAALFNGILLFICVGANVIAWQFFVRWSLKVFALSLILYTFGTCFTFLYFRLLRKEARGYIWSRLTFGLFVVASIAAIAFFQVAAFIGFASDEPELVQSWETSNNDYAIKAEFFCPALVTGKCWLTIEAPGNRRKDRRLLTLVHGDSDAELHLDDHNFLMAVSRSGGAHNYYLIPLNLMNRYRTRLDLYGIDSVILDSVLSGLSADGNSIWVGPVKDNPGVMVIASKDTSWYHYDYGLVFAYCADLIRVREYSDDFMTFSVSWPGVGTKDYLFVFRGSKLTELCERR